MKVLISATFEEFEVERKEQNPFAEDIGKSKGIKEDENKVMKVKGKLTKEKTLGKLLTGS